LNPRNTWENPELLMKTLRCSKRIPWKELQKIWRCQSSYSRCSISMVNYRSTLVKPFVKERLYFYIVRQEMFMQFSFLALNLCVIKTRPLAHKSIKTYSETILLFYAQVQTKPSETCSEGEAK
jgi:hypothetical protein